MLLSDIGPQPQNRSDPGSTLVCVTLNINTTCCKDGNNENISNDTSGAVGEWHYPNGTLFPHTGRGSVVNVGTICYSHQIRLARVVSDPTPPLGVYTCEVPGPSTGVV